MIFSGISALGNVMMPNAVVFQKHSCSRQSKITKLKHDPYGQQQTAEEEEEEEDDGEDKVIN